MTIIKYNFISTHTHTCTQACARERTILNVSVDGKCFIFGRGFTIKHKYETEKNITI